MAFQPAPNGDEVAGVFSLADCGYEDVVLIPGWSMKPHNEFLIPRRESVFFFVWRSPVPPC